MTAGRTHPLRKGTSSSTCILLGRPSLCSRSAQSTRTARAVKTCNWAGPAAAKRLPRQGETAALRTWAGTSETGPLALEPRLQAAEAVLQEKLYLRERAVAAGNRLPGALRSAHPCLRPTCASLGRQHGAGHQFRRGGLPPRRPCELVLTSYWSAPARACLPLNQLVTREPTNQAAESIFYKAPPK